MEQGLLFDFPQFKITKKIRLIELFGGIGSQAMALRDIGADFEHYKLIEFDKYAVQSYNAIHNTQHTTHDIRQTHASDLEITDKDKYCYLMTYSFPCTDLSVAGKMQGMSKEEWEKGNSTRSGLLWEVERILKECDELPDVLLMENVPQVHADQNKADFNNWCNFLRSKGYINHWQDLNAKDYGIPQNRDRCFMVSILSDNFIDFDFPKPVKLEKVMRDFLEESVDEKYYINTEKAKKLIDDLISRSELKNKDCVDLTLHNPQKNKIANTITAREDRGVAEINKIGNGIIEKTITRIIGGLEGHERKGGGVQTGYQVFDPEYICPAQLADGGGYGILIVNKKNICVAMRGRNPESPTNRTAGISTEQRLETAPQGMVNTLTTVQKDNMVLECGFYKKAIETAVKENAQPGDVIDAFNGKVRKDVLCIETKIKKVGQISNEGSQCGTVVLDEGLAPTLSAGTHGYANAHIVTQYRIRKLTPRECWRLMGYTDEDFEKAHNAGVSNSQLYKQAGNAIVKQVLMAIFSQML